jgi:hypothetical protein
VREAPLALISQNPPPDNLTIPQKEKSLQITKQQLVNA